MLVQRFFFRVLFLIIPILFSSCEENELTIIPNNLSPADNTVSKTAILNYVNKSYISLWGLEPGDSLRDEDIDFLTRFNMSDSARQVFIQRILDSESFNINSYSLARAELLNNLNVDEIPQEIQLIDFLLSDPQFAIFQKELERERRLLNDLMNIPNDMASGFLNVVGMLKRCVSNKLYDDINMGTENFVISNFQHFLFREPTANELENGKQMVDGFETLFFRKAGNSKDDFVAIFFDDTGMKEGLIIALYKRFLFRNPNEEELFKLLQQFESNTDYNQVVLTITSGKEFAGLN